MTETDYRHRCTTAECPYLGQLTDDLSCNCHRKEAEIMREQLAKLTTPRPLSEYHEDMGDVLWWCWTTAKPLLRKRGGDNELPEPGHWLGEPPYVGSPNDLGQIVEIGIRTARLKHFAGACRVNIGGWPGYHTHFTPLPPMPVKP